MEHAWEATTDAKRHKNTIELLKTAKEGAEQRAKAVTKVADVAEAVLNKTEKKPPK